MRPDSDEKDAFALTQAISWSQKRGDCMAQGVLFAAFLGAENICNQRIGKEMY